jgi:hypothetical protein
MIRAITSSTQTIFGKSPVKENDANMSADNISLAAFREALSKYPSILKTFSKTRKFVPSLGIAPGCKLS